MEFETLLQIVGQEPLFNTGLLLAGYVNPKDIRKQLSRWYAAGKIYQLRRGWYCLAPLSQKATPHPFLIANRIHPGSYVSLQSALSYYGMIPEGVPVTTSVTTGRPQSFQTPLGLFDYRHTQVDWFAGYAHTDLGNGQTAFVATAEKALLDLVYLQPKGDTLAYLRSLRLQALDQINVGKMQSLAKSLGKLKLERAVSLILALIEEEASFQSL